MKENRRKKNMFAHLSTCSFFQISTSSTVNDLYGLVQTRLGVPEEATCASLGTVKDRQLDFLARGQKLVFSTRLASLGSSASSLPKVFSPTATDGSSRPVFIRESEAGSASPSPPPPPAPLAPAPPAPVSPTSIAPSPPPRPVGGVPPPPPLAAVKGPPLLPHPPISLRHIAGCIIPVNGGTGGAKTVWDNMNLAPLKLSLDQWKVALDNSHVERTSLDLAGKYNVEQIGASGLSEIVFFFFFFFLFIVVFFF